jgi:hypothetical protein
VRAAVRTRDLDDVISLEVTDLEVIDLSEPRRVRMEAATDFRTFEDRYAVLAFGLGTVPRRQRAAEPLWQRPAGALVAVSAVLAVLTLVSTAH